MIDKPTWVRLVREPLTHSEYLKLHKIEGRIRCSADVHALLRERAGAELVEVFWSILLASQSQIVALQEITRGTLNGTLIHPREVFRGAIAQGATSIILAHNHPSGDPTHSAEDQTITRKVVEAGKLLDIPVLDHVIVTSERYFSFAEAGLL